VTPSVSSNGPPAATGQGKGLAETLPPACTSACTSEPGNANVGTVDALAAALMGLSAEDLARLVAMLLDR
jgi:hypothetical protein